MCPPFFALHLLNKIQIADCNCFPTTVRLAPPTHLEERSLPIGDELAESLLVSKSRITQVILLSRSLDNASAVAGSHDSRCSPTLPDGRSLPRGPYSSQYTPDSGQKAALTLQRGFYVQSPAAESIACVCCTPSRSVQPAIRRQAQIDAVVVGQVLRLLWWGASRNTTGRRQPPYECPARYGQRSCPSPLGRRISRQR
jgi:hypothetical protein